MTATSISFLSSRGRGICYDMKVMQAHLGELMDDVSFRYFVTSEMSSNPFVKRAHRTAKKIFCKDLTNVVCVDASLDRRMKLIHKDGKRILAAIPFGYQFEYAQDLDKNLPLRNSFKMFTHVMAPSPFTAELLKKRYKLDKIHLMDNICSPLSWSISQTAYQKARKEKLAYYFPHIMQKKILVIIHNGKVSDEFEKMYQAVDMKKFLEDLGEDWFVLTSCKELLESAEALSYKYHDRFGYVDENISTADLLYVADAMITNSSMLACTFSARRCPTYCLGYNESYFEQYVEKHYPSLYVKSLEEFAKNQSLEEDLSEEQKRFCEWFSYPADVNPMEEIYKVLVQ